MVKENLKEVPQQARGLPEGKAFHAHGIATAKGLKKVYL